MIDFGDHDPILKVTWVLDQMLTCCLSHEFIYKDCRKFVKLSFVCTLSGENKIDCTKVTVSTFVFHILAFDVSTMKEE